jgi:GrpB-like predicted nucleotidyltransferase (UPF0157 family)
VDDIDIRVFCKKKEYTQHIGNLEKVFGKCSQVMENSIKWEFEKDGFHVDLNLIDSNTEFQKKSMGVFNKLKNKPELLKVYEEMKINFNGKSYREYQKAKFEFFNKILNNNF